jgi:hypothetical protein
MVTSMCVRACERTGVQHPRCKGVRGKDENLSGTRVGNEEMRPVRGSGGLRGMSAVLSHFEGRFAGKRGVGGVLFGVRLHE